MSPIHCQTDGYICCLFLLSERRKFMKKMNGGKHDAKDKRRVNIFYSYYSMDDGLCHDLV